MTPISDAVRLAAEDLRFTEQKATVILITDGLETCEVDPCALASDLESQGIDFTTHVLGFGLSDEEGQQVACLAENTGGQYLSAADGDALVEALTTTVAQVVQAEPEPAPSRTRARTGVPTSTTSRRRRCRKVVRISSMRTPTWSGNGTRSLPMAARASISATDYYSGFEGTLEPGDYIMTAHAGLRQRGAAGHHRGRQSREPHFVLNGAMLKLHPRAAKAPTSMTMRPSKSAMHGDYITTSYGDIDLVVPAGALEVDISIGEAKVTRSYTPRLAKPSTRM